MPFWGISCTTPIYWIGALMATSLNLCMPLGLTIPACLHCPLGCGVFSVPAMEWWGSTKGKVETLPAALDPTTGWKVYESRSRSWRPAAASDFDGSGFIPHNRGQALGRAMFGEDRSQKYRTITVTWPYLRGGGSRTFLYQPSKAPYIPKDLKERFAALYFASASCDKQRGIWKEPTYGPIYLQWTRTKSKNAKKPDLGSYFTVGTQSQLKDAIGKLSIPRADYVFTGNKESAGDTGPELVALDAGKHKYFGKPEHMKTLYGERKYYSNCCCNVTWPFLETGLSSCFWRSTWREMDDDNTGHLRCWPRIVPAGDKKFGIEYASNTVSGFLNIKSFLKPHWDMLVEYTLWGCRATGLRKEIWNPLMDELGLKEWKIAKNANQEDATTPDAPTDPEGPTDPSAPETWQCPHCPRLNPASNAACDVCKVAKGESPAEEFDEATKAKHATEAETANASDAATASTRNDDTSNSAKDKSWWEGLDQTMKILLIVGIVCFLAAVVGLVYCCMCMEKEGEDPYYGPGNDYYMDEYDRDQAPAGANQSPRAAKAANPSPGGYPDKIPYE